MQGTRGLGFAVVEGRGFIEGENGIFVKNITEGSPADMVRHSLGTSNTPSCFVVQPVLTAGNWSYVFRVTSYAKHSVVLREYTILTLFE